MPEKTHSSALWIISVVGLVLSTVVFLARGIVRWRVLGLEDLVLVTAQVLAFGQYAALFVSLHYGLGRSSDLLTIQSRNIVSKAAFSSQILTIFALGLSKCSIVLTIRRLFAPYQKHCWLICNCLVAVFCVWLVGAVALVSVGCDVEKYIPPTGNDTCVAFSTRWNIIIALDVISELFMLSLPLYFLFPLEIDLQHKARVVLAFALRLPYVVLLFGYLVSISTASGPTRVLILSSVSAFVITFSILFTLANVSPTRSHIIATALLWQQLELSYSLISATVPCLRWFSGSLFTFESNTVPIDDYNSWPDGSYKLSQSRSRSYSGSLKKHISGAMSAKESIVQAAINLTAVRPKDVERDAGHVQHHVGRLRPERLNSKTVISGGVRQHSRNNARSQSGSQELIIRRDVRFLVENHHAVKGSKEHSQGGP